MCLGPVRSTSILARKVLEVVEEASIPGIEAVWFELNNPNPAGDLTVAWAKPNVVGSRDTDFDWKMRANTVGISMLLVEPGLEFTEERLSTFQRERPFGGMVRILQVESSEPLFDVERCWKARHTRQSILKMR